MKTTKLILVTAIVSMLTSGLTSGALHWAFRTSAPATEPVSPAAVPGFSLAPTADELRRFAERTGRPAQDWDKVAADLRRRIPDLEKLPAELEEAKKVLEANADLIRKARVEFENGNQR